MEAHRDGVFSVEVADFSGYRAVVGHGAGEFSAAGVGGLPDEDLRNCSGAVGRIHIECTGTGDRSAGLVMSGDAG